MALVATHPPPMPPGSMVPGALFGVRPPPPLTTSPLPLGRWSGGCGQENSKGPVSSQWECAGETGRDGEWAHERKEQCPKTSQLTRNAELSRNLRSFTQLKSNQNLTAWVRAFMPQCWHLGRCRRSVSNPLGAMSMLTLLASTTLKKMRSRAGTFQAVGGCGHVRRIPLYAQLAVRIL